MRLLNRLSISIGLILVIGIFTNQRPLYAGDAMLVPPYYQPQGKPVTPEGVCGCSLTGGWAEASGGAALSKVTQARSIDGRQSHPTSGTNAEPVAGVSGGYDWSLAGNGREWQLIAGVSGEFDWSTADTGGQAQIGPDKFRHHYTGPIGASSYSGSADLYTGLVNGRLGVAYKCFELYGFGGLGLTGIDESDQGASGLERVRGRCYRYLIENREYSLGNGSSLDFTWDAGVGAKYALSTRYFIGAHYTYEVVEGFQTEQSLKADIGCSF